MTRLPPHPPGRIDHRHPATDDAIVVGFALVGLLFAALVAISYPVAATAVAGAVAGILLLARTGVPALGRRLHGRATELEVPGVGIVQIRFSTR